MKGEWIQGDSSISLNRGGVLTSIPAIHVRGYLLGSRVRSWLESPRPATAIAARPGKGKTGRVNESESSLYASSPRNAEIDG